VKYIMTVELEIWEEIRQVSSLDYSNRVGYLNMV